MTVSMLVVDDEECDVVRFRRATRKAGLKRRIDVCRSATEALRQLAIIQKSEAPSQPKCLVISDLNMPGMRGAEFVARLRDDVGLSVLPAFILSSSASNADVEKALSCGANGYILKCDSEMDYLAIVRWFDECCREMEQGRCLEEESWFPQDRPPHLIAGPVAITRSAMQCHGKRHHVFRPP